MRLPDISRLQFLVLGTLLRGAVAGRAIRAQLNDYGVRKSGPGFYQLMARLEDAELIEGWYESRQGDGRTVRERHYRVTAHGRVAWTESSEFFLKVIRDVGDVAATPT